VLVSLLGNRLPRVAAPLFPDLLWRRPDGTRTLYLTFDDGPCPKTTAATLDLLDRYGLRAAFFLLGGGARRHPGLVRAIHDAGHAVAQHTDTHPDAWKTPPDLVEREMASATAVLEDLTGAPVRWMRPPYGRFTTSMRRWCRAHGQRIVMWDVMPGDFLPKTTTDDVLRRTLGLVRPGSILVLHEGNHAATVTPAALERLLPRLLDEGYRFGTL